MPTLHWDDLRWYLALADRAERLLSYHPKHPTCYPKNRIARYI